MDNAEYIWRWLWERLGNECGTAGLMGNLCAESGLKPDNLQNSFERLLGMTDAEYTEAVDNGSYTEDQFVHDGAGYGLMQLTYPSRKQGLFDLAKLKDKSIGDMELQLEFLWTELGSNFRKVLNTLFNAKSVREASDAVMLGYEIPADQSEDNRAARAELGQMYYDRFAVPAGRRLVIYKRMFYGSDCYKQGTVQTPKGVQVHSTGANNPYLKRYVQPDDGRLGYNPNGNDHNHPGGNVCANAYIGKLQDGTVAVYEALPWDYRCWLSGSGKNGNANKLGYIGFEVCEDGMKSREYFEDSVLDKAVLLTAYWCQEFGFNADEYVRDHSELHGMGLASNHGDISEWLKAFGYTMNDFRARVKEAMKDGVSVTYIDCDETGVLFRARAINPGTYLNIRSGKGTMYASVGKIPQGEICDVLDDTDSAWWKVHFRGVTGYAMSEYLERIPEDNDDGGVPGGEQDEGGGDATEGGTEDKDGYFIPRRLAVELFGVLGAQLGDEAKMILDCRSETLINEDYR